MTTKPLAAKATANKPLVYLAKTRIDHSVFGTGTIIASNSVHTTIAFDEGKTRKFVTPMVVLRPTDTPAPPRRTAKRKTKAKTAAKPKVAKAKTTKTKAEASAPAKASVKAAKK